MRKLITIILLFITSVSLAQTYSNTGTANLQRAPTAKGYIYRNNMGVLGNVNWYTSPQIDSLITIAVGGGVVSFNTRTGAVVPLLGDYSAFYPSLTGSYANPSWITSLAYSKLTGVPAFKLNSDTTYPHGYVPQWQLRNSLTDSTLFSKRIIYARQWGAVLNYNPITRGGTDDRAKLQSAIDTLSNRGGGTLVIDGQASIHAELVLKSNVKIVGNGIGSSGVHLADNSNQNVITTTWSPIIGNTVNISIQDITVDGNGSHNNRYYNKDSTSVGADANYGILLLGVRGVTLKNVYLLNAKTFGYMISNWENIYMENCSSIHSAEVVGTSNNHDGIHLLGTGNNLTCIKFRSNGDDDVLALNTNEYLSVNAAKYGTTCGATTNLHFIDTKADTARNFLRLYGVPANPGSRVIDNVTFENTIGYIYGSGVFQGGSIVGTVAFNGYHLSGSSEYGIGLIAFPIAATTLIINDVNNGTPVNVGAVSNTKGSYFNGPVTGYRIANAIPFNGAGGTETQDAANLNYASGNMGLNTATPGAGNVPEDDGNSYAFENGSQGNTVKRGAFFASNNGGAFNQLNGYFGAIDNALTSGYKVRGLLSWNNLDAGTTGKLGSVSRWYVRQDNSTTLTTAATARYNLFSVPATLQQGTVLSSLLKADASGNLVPVVSGTDIKTINSTSLLGSGNISLQTPITFGTGVQTSLGVNIGSAGAPILFNGAGGTPSSMTGTNITGTASGLNVGGNAATVTTIPTLSGDVSNSGNVITVNKSGGVSFGSNAFTSTHIPTVGTANTIMKSDGTNLVNSSATDDGTLFSISTIFVPKNIESNTVSISTSLANYYAITPNGYFGFRQGTDHSYNIDGFTTNTNLFKMLQNGKTSFSATVSGADAVNATDYVTKQQVGSIVGVQNAVSANFSNLTTAFPAINKAYNISGLIEVSSGIGTVIMYVTWTDINNNAQSKTFYNQGATAASITGDSSFPPMTIRAKAGTTIAVNTTLTGTATYNCAAYITPLDF